MDNKYRGTNPPLSDPQKLLGREEALRELGEHIKGHRSVVIMGVEGVGKSSLLNCYFHPRYRREMALKEKLLIRITDFPTDRDSDGVYQYLAEGVLSSVDALDQEETEELYWKLREKCLRRMNDCRDAASRFQQLCEVIQDFGYHIMLVIDGFERFVSSPQVKMEHHDLMNNLISKNLSFVVATNYDFNKTSLPETVSGSFLLMKFSGNEIRLQGLSEQDCAGLTDPGDFTGEELHQLWILSGGIPALFRKAAKHAYAQKMAGPIDWEAVFDNTYLDTADMTARWCKWLSEDQVRVLNALADSDPNQLGLSFSGDSLETAAQALVNRGLLANPVQSGNLNAITGIYKCSTPLLTLYCLEHELRAETFHPIDSKAPAAPAETEDDELIEGYSSWAGQGSRSLNEPISDALLRQYQLSRETFSGYTEPVQRFIHTGIIVDQLLMDVALFDHSPQFIEFAKAAEAHLNDTLLPVLRLVDPSFILKKGSGGKEDQTLGNAGHLMLGQFLTILNWKYRFTTFTDSAGQFCADRQLNSFPKTWWEKLKRDMNDVGGLPTKRETLVDIRNGISHVEFVSAERGEALLKTMFAGEKSLFNRCQSLYEQFVKASIL